MVSGTASCFIAGTDRIFPRTEPKISVTMIVTVENINQQKQTITVVNTKGDEEQRVVLNAPDFFTNMLEVSDREYLATYVCYKNNPYRGKLSTMILFQEN